MDAFRCLCVERVDRLVLSGRTTRGSRGRHDGVDRSHLCGPFVAFLRRGTQELTASGRLPGLAPHSSSSRPNIAASWSRAPSAPSPSAYSVTSSPYSTPRVSTLSRLRALTGGWPSL